MTRDVTLLIGLKLAYKLHFVRVSFVAGHVFLALEGPLHLICQRIWLAPRPSVQATWLLLSCYLRQQFPGLISRIELHWRMSSLTLFPICDGNSHSFMPLS